MLFSAPALQGKARPRAQPAKDRAQAGKSTPHGQARKGLALARAGGISGRSERGAHGVPRAPTQTAPHAPAQTRAHILAARAGGLPASAGAILAQASRYLTQDSPTFGIGVHTFKHTPAHYRRREAADRMRLKRTNVHDKLVENHAKVRSENCSVSSSPSVPPPRT